MKCKQCHANVYLTDLVCLQCGHVSEKYIAKDESILQTISSQVSKVKTLLDDNSFDPSPYNWNGAVKKLAQKIHKTQQLLTWGELANQTPDDLKKQMANFLAYSADAELHVAFVGAIKAGKSSLINALLKEDLASTSVTPETASLTKFRASNNGKHSVKIIFYSHSEWESLWSSAQNNGAEVFMNEYRQLQADQIKDSYVGQPSVTIPCHTLEALKVEIHKWSSSKAPTHYFVKELEIHLANSDIPQGVIFVDTPGLDDIVDYRSNITRSYIERANAVLVCVRADALTSSEMNTILKVFANTRHNPEKVYVIGTKYDTLNRPKEDWAKQKEEWLKYLEINSAYGSRSLAEKNLFITSSMLYQTAMHTKNTSRDDDNYFDLMSIVSKFKLEPTQIEENKDYLIEISNIHNLYRKLNNHLLNNYQSDLISDIEKRFTQVTKRINSFIINVGKSQAEILEVTQKNLDDIERFKTLKESQLAHLATEKNELEADIKVFEKTAFERSKMLFDAVRSLKV